MSTNTTPTNAPSIDYIVGKNYGMTGRRLPINQYKRKAEKVTYKFKKLKTDEFKMFKEAVKSSLDDFNKYLTRINRDIEKLEKSAIAAYNKLDELLSERTGKDPLIVEKSKELYTVYSESIKNIQEKEKGLELAVAERLISIETKLKELEDKVLKGHNEYMDNLNNNILNIMKAQSGWEVGASFRRTVRDDNDNIIWAIKNLWK